MVARVEDVAEPGSFQLIDVDGENVILVRGRDDVIRAFYNVCRHRGTAVEERECGKAVRFQCPYHAWIYDLDGRLIRAKHTEDLEDFSFDTFGLREIHSATWQGFVFLNLSDGPVAPLEDQLGDLVAAHGAVRVRPPPRREADRVRGRRRTGSSSPRTTASATTARASTRSSTS